MRSLLLIPPAHNDGCRTAPGPFDGDADDDNPQYLSSLEPSPVPRPPSPLPQKASPS